MIRYIYLAGCLLINIALFAQAPVPAFTASTVSGCAPLSVTFTDKSTGNPVFWDWDFGLTALSTQQNPTATFYNPGTYTIKLVVRNANGTAGRTETNYITVLASPIASFTSDLTTACQPATINFQDLSTSSLGTLNAWNWTFGDGGTSTQRNPSHVFKDNGFYTVTLNATSSSGCSGTASFGRYIRVVSGVKADFSPKPSDTCIAPFNVNFTNLSTGPGNISYIWQYQDGTTSTTVNPTKSYPASGNFNVKLIATSELGCKDSVQKSVSVSGTNVQFNPPVGPCVNTPLTFTNTSATGAVSTTWDFGDGSGSTVSSPSKTFAAPGTYTVSLSSVYGNCKGTTSQSIVVSPPPSVDFTADRTISCKAPLIVNFTANSPAATKWSWNFGDGSPVSTLQNPQHTYTSLGIFDVSLTITNANGCTSSINKVQYINVSPPTIEMKFAGEGCINTVYNPLLNNNISITSVEAITSYTWDWGDNTGTSSGQFATHVYTAEGAYTVTLTVTTGGCSVTKALPGAALFGTPVAVDFTVNKLTLCDKEAAVFTNASLPAGDAWLWDLGDGILSTTTTISHEYALRKKYTISLQVRNKGCYSLLTKTDLIEALPPTAKFNFKLVDCADPLEFNFVSVSDTSMPPVKSTYEWDFAGIANGSGANTTFKFPAFNTYKVTLKVTEDGNTCSSIIVHDIPVFKENATLSSDKSTYCKNEKAEIKATVVQPQYISKYVWQIDGGIPFEKSSKWDTIFTAPGTYIITCTLTDINGCPFVENSPLSITVVGPTAKFEIPDYKGCKNDIIAFTDQSTATSGIKSWQWTWGDTKSNTFVSLNTPFTHQYADSGNYTVKLLVMDNNNCPDLAEYTDTVKIRQPIADFSAASTLFCRGGNLQFTDTSRGYDLTYEWSFGDGKTSTDQNPIQVYDGADNKYTVSLKITDDAGCVDTKSLTNYIEIRSPKLAFTVSDTISVCRVFETKFIFGGKDYLSYSWDFGDFATSETKDPTHFYNDFGTYTAKLYLTGYGGCLDSATHSIQVVQASASMINYTVPPFACNEINVDFTLNPIPGVRFDFNFGDGIIDSSKNLSFSHFYNSPNSFVPVIQLTDKQNCISAAGGSSQITIIGAKPFYSQNRKSFCDNGDVAFAQLIQNNDPVTSFVWDFGDNTTSSLSEVIHNYSMPGTYITSLTVNTASGCNKTLTDTVRVYRTPTASILSNDKFCFNDQIKLTAGTVVIDTALSFKWTAPGITSSDSIIMLKPTSSGQITVNLQATNKIGCSSPVESKVITVYPLPVITMPPSFTTPVGFNVPIPVTYNDPALTYVWTPATYLDCTDCAIPIVTGPKFSTTYKLKVTDNNSCSSKASIQLNTICNNINYFVPNTFSPNGDGNNDSFYPRGTFVNNVQSLRIFSRWGEMVFEKRNFAANSMTEGWNGLYKGKPAVADVYIYIMEIICENAQIISLKGDVTLIR